MPLEDIFIGRGWSFPPSFPKPLNGVEMRSGIADIEESLRIIFTTALGERVMNPTFGCALDDSVFDVMNTSRVAWLENLIRTAIIYHEPRIDADRITVEPDATEGRLLIAVSYKVRATNSRFNMVFPFYLNRP
jgi:phage baseplate assembly protein W